jgi:hypothetical protein
MIGRKIFRPCDRLCLIGRKIFRPYGRLYVIGQKIFRPYGGTLKPIGKHLKNVFEMFTTWRWDGGALKGRESSIRAQRAKPKNFHRRNGQ